MRLSILAALSLTLTLALTASAAVDIDVRAHYPADKLPSSSSSAFYLRGSLAGCGMSWKKGVVMQQDASNPNDWKLTVRCELANTASSLLEVKIALDDHDQQYQVGANVKIELKMDSKEVDIFPWFDAANVGRWEYIQGIYSPQLNNTRNLVIWLPPSYDENTLKPMSDVLILHDGNNLFDPDCPGGGCCPFGCWSIQDTLGPLIIEGGMREVLIIGVWNSPDRDDEMTYSYDPSQKEGGKGDLYLDFIGDTVIPVVKKAYPRVSESVSEYGMLGSSLGGLITCYAGWTRPQAYSTIGCMSSSFWWNSQDFNSTVIPAHSDPLPSITAYMDTGDDALNTTELVRDTMLDLGFNKAPGHRLKFYYDPGGQHNEKYWGARFHIPMSYLYPSIVV